MSVGEQQAGDCLSVDTVGVWRPIGFGVGSGVSKPVQLKGAGHDAHHVACTPQHADG